MGYKQIMQGVTKAQAITFVNYVNREFERMHFRNFELAVADGLRLIMLPGSAPDTVNSNTANAVVDRMERKAGLVF